MWSNLLMLAMGMALVTAAYEGKPKRPKIRPAFLELPPNSVIDAKLSYVRTGPPSSWSHANWTYSLPLVALTFDLDALGWTKHTPASTVLSPGRRKDDKDEGPMTLAASYISALMEERRKKDGPMYLFKKHPEEVNQALTGLERALLYVSIEDKLTFFFNLDGKACLLRAICEAHSTPSRSFGLVGEFFLSFLTPSLSPFANLMSEYVLAERRGKDGGVECIFYHAECGRSIFTEDTWEYPREFPYTWSEHSECSELNKDGESVLTVIMKKEEINE